jgi:hypothetical protein
MQVVVQETTFARLPVLAARDLKTLNGQTFCPKIARWVGMSNVPASGRFLLIALASGQPWRFAIPRRRPEPHRQARRQPRAYAAHDAFNEPTEAGRWARSHLPAGAEIREGHLLQVRNCAPAECECHDLAPVAQSAAWGSACTQGGSARPDAQRGPNCSTPARKFTVAATGDRSASS